MESFLFIPLRLGCVLLLQIDALAYTLIDPKFLESWLPLLLGLFRFIRVHLGLELAIVMFFEDFHMLDLEQLLLFLVHDYVKRAPVELFLQLLLPLLVFLEGLSDQLLHRLQPTSPRRTHSIWAFFILIVFFRFQGIQVKIDQRGFFLCLKEQLAHEEFAVT